MRSSAIACQPDRTLKSGGSRTVFEAGQAAEQRASLAVVAAREISAIGLERPELPLRFKLPDADRGIRDPEIPDSLDAADEIVDQDPTLFQQWEEKVNAHPSTLDQVKKLYTVVNVLCHPGTDASRPTLTYGNVGT